MSRETEPRKTLRFSYVIYYAMLPTQRIWRETVLLIYFILLMLCDLEVTNESARCWEQISSYSRTYRKRPHKMQTEWSLTGGAYKNQTTGGSLPRRGPDICMKVRLYITMPRFHEGVNKLLRITRLKIHPLKTLSFLLLYSVYHIHKRPSQSTDSSKRTARALCSLSCQQ